MVVEAAKGLDSVAFIMEVEDCFGISIPDAEAETIHTVAGLFSSVRLRFRASSSAQCLTAKAFYQLRRSLVTLTGRSRSSIRPDTQLEELLPQADRRTQWHELERLMGLKLPRLIRPAALVHFNERTGLLVMTLLTLGIFGSLAKQHWVPTVAFPLAGLMIAGAIWRTLRTPPIDFPGCSTVGELARFVWAKNCKLQATQGASDQQIWEAIVNIVSESIGMKASDVTPELRFNDIEQDLWHH
jgi:acyl carrier protein